ncbi:hypothetical protein [Microseira sp. BLCC-F43]|jgi:hypothetical protein|uniref:hypothetical protein n=1 Tax=Microseira sp. BLCC-F43 TaxID=3153602 RepID=UPI0035BB7D71
MAENLNQPRPDDAVLGGLAGVKRRLASDVVANKLFGKLVEFQVIETGIQVNEYQKKHLFQPSGKDTTGHTGSWDWQPAKDWWK